MNKEYDVKERIFAAIDEKIYEFDHASGLHVQYIPKRGFRKKFAVLATDFGSINTSYSTSEGKFSVPDGTAHFLEHKLYEQPGKDVMNEFAAMGAECNAATGYSKTYYYFECTENFEGCLDLLLRHVFHPYFTDKNVEKEKGIIIQEINMYLDDPYYVNSTDLADLLYINNPVKKDIAGTEESVKSITPDILYRCHKLFYRPDNMCLTVVGDVDIEIIYNALERAELCAYTGEKPEKILPAEAKNLNGRFFCRKMETSMPIFSFGFKDYPEKYTAEERIYRRHTVNAARELLFGTSSDLYEKLYDKGIINYDFYASYEIERDYAMFSISGTSEKYEEVRMYIENYIDKIRKNGVNRQDFEILKKAMCGSVIRAFDSLSYIGKVFGQMYLQGADAFDYFLSCGKIRYEDVNSVVADLLSSEMAVSVIERLD